MMLVKSERSFCPARHGGQHCGQDRGYQHRFMAVRTVTRFVQRRYDRACIFAYLLRGNVRKQQNDKPTYSPTSTATCCGLPWDGLFGSSASEAASP
jgi:hypothetical protein